jgi:hypothetical protein
MDGLFADKTSLSEVSCWAAILHRSCIARDIFRRLDWDNEWGKTGSSNWNCRQSWGILDRIIAPLGEHNTALLRWKGASSVRSDHDHAAPVKVPLIPDFYNVLEKFSQSVEGFGKPLGLAQQRLDSIWGDLLDLTRKFRTIVSFD